jgi:hypothetical protein
MGRMLLAEITRWVATLQLKDMICCKPSRHLEDFSPRGDLINKVLPKPQGIPGKTMGARLSMAKPHTCVPVDLKHTVAVV